MSSTFNARTAAAYEKFMGRWSQLSVGLPNLRVSPRATAFLMLDPESDASSAFCWSPRKKYRRRSRQFNRSPMPAVR
jgi:hypothetical protein